MSSKKVNDTKLYDILGVPSDAANEDIKKAYRKLAMKWHPDKWQKATEAEKQEANEQFKKISSAYEILCDEEKREMYDRYGEVDNQGGNPNMNADIFRDMFGNMGGFNMGGFPFGQQKQKQQKIVVPNITCEVKLDMSDVYNGKTIDIEIQRYTLKKGKNPTKTKMTCEECEGRGMITKMKKLAPGMMQQIQQQCDKCNGACIIFPADCFEKEQIKISKAIPKGVFQGTKITIDNMGHEIPKSFDESSK